MCGGGKGRALVHLAHHGKVELVRVWLAVHVNGALRLSTPKTKGQPNVIVWVIIKTVHIRIGPDHRNENYQTTPKDFQKNNLQQIVEVPSSALTPTLK